MNISPASISADSLAAVQDQAALLVLKKTMNQQAQSVLELLNALPQAPALATEGSVGTQVNTFA